MCFGVVGYSRVGGGSNDDRCVIMAAVVFTELGKSNDGIDSIGGGMVILY